MTTKLAVLLMTVCSLAAGAAPPSEKTGPASWGDDSSHQKERFEEYQRRTRLLLVVSIAEALELNEAEALKLSEKVRAIEEKRSPLREQMHLAMREVKRAADGEAAALSQVDAQIQKVLDGRAQMAALDKELFTFLAKDLTPQRKAKLALVLAKLQEQRGGKKGRHR